MRRSRKPSSKKRAGVLLGLFCALSLVAFASAAHASKTIYDSFGSSGTGPGQFDSSPGQVALNQTSGDVYVVDVGNYRVERFDPDGAFLSQFGSLGSGPGEFDFAGNPSGIAVDDSDGSVYVLDIANNRVQKFTASGAFIDAFGEAGSGDGQFNFPAGIAVDPSTGDVYVADTGNNRVQKFDSAGNYVDQFGAEGSGDGQFSGPARLTVDSTGDVYVLERFNRVQKFDSAGNFDSVFAAGPVLELTIDPANDHVFINRYTDDFSSLIVAELDATGTVVDTHQAASGNGIAVNSTTGKIYLGEHQRVFILDDPTPDPTGSTDPTTNVTGESATLNGTLDPNGPPGAEYYFEYSVNGSDWTPLSGPIDAGKGTDPIAVSQALEGLEPNFTYHSRLRYGKKFGSSFSAAPEVTFTTDPLAPTVLTRTPLPVTDTTARLRGSIDPNNDATSYYFEYGSTTAYGTRIPIPDGAAGAGGKSVAVSILISGLDPESTYHYRLVAENSTGIGEGEDVGFTTQSTSAADWPERRIELVSNPDKAGQPFLESLLHPAGNLSLWSIAGGPGTPTGIGDSFLATRTSSGWVSKTISPPIGEMIGEGRLSYFPLTATPDYKSFIFEVTRKGDGTPTYIVRRNPDGGQEVLAQFAAALGQEGTPTTATPDLKHVFLLLKEHLDPEHPPGTFQVYDVGNGTPEIVSRTPGGAIASCGVRNNEAEASGFAYHTAPYKYFSTDPSVTQKVFYNASECGAPERIYRRDLESGETITINPPPVSGEDLPAYFVRATADGSSVAFLTRANLDPEGEDTDASGTDIYRWTEGEGVDCVTCVAEGEANVEGTGFGQFTGSAISPDLSYVYFSTTNAVSEGAPAEGLKLYLVKDGEIRYISPISDTLIAYMRTEGEDGESVMSNDGSKLFFISNSPSTTPEDTGLCSTTSSPEPCLRFFRYDANSDSLECITCPLVDSHLTRPKDENIGDSTARRTFSDFAPQSPISDDGHTFVFESAQPFVADDINRVTDIYEWRDGRYRLITDGVTEFAGRGPHIYGISGDSSTVLFELSNSLTGHEIEPNAPTLYAARMNGGFPPPPPPPALCKEDDCQGPLVAPPPLSSAGSSHFAGPGNQAERTNRRGRKCGKGHRRVRQHGKVRCVNRKSRRGR